MAVDGPRIGATLKNEQRTPLPLSMRPIRHRGAFVRFQNARNGTATAEGLDPVYRRAASMISRAMVSATSSVVRPSCAARSKMRVNVEGIWLTRAITSSRL